LIQLKQTKVDTQPRIQEGVCPKMCVQVNSRYTCGCRTFKRIDPCKYFPQSCAGPSGNHADEPTWEVCDTHKQRLDDALDGRGMVADPWGEGDPYKTGKKNEDKKKKKKGKSKK
jgi:hypothetical protein